MIPILYIPKNFLQRHVPKIFELRALSNCINRDKRFFE